MLFFIDESWQTSKDEKYKIGVLAATQIKSHDFNEVSRQFFYMKSAHLGANAGNIEVKGRNIFRDYLFRLEAKGIPSKELNLARDILAHMKKIDVRGIASIVFSRTEMDLACANVNQLERPFFFLFERIDLFMKENHPGLMAKLIFDDRGHQTNDAISKSVSNFFHKSSAGKSFSSIIKTPFFALSGECVGIQMTDMVASILGARFTGDRKRGEFFTKLKELEFMSRSTVPVNGAMLPVRGFKIIKEKETGDLKTREESVKSMRRLESPPPVSAKTIP